MLCTSCRKEEEARTWWERLRAWVMHFFHDEMLDWGNGRFTQGFGEGYRKGSEDARDLAGFTMQWQQLITELKKGYDAKLKLDTCVDLEQVINGVADEKGNTIGLSLGTDRLSDDAIKELKIEAEYFLKSRLWNIMQETVKKLAVDKSINMAVDFEQVLAGKMMLHNLGVLRSIVEAIEKAKTMPSKIVVPPTTLGG